MLKSSVSFEINDPAPKIEKLPTLILSLKVEFTPIKEFLHTFTLPEITTCEEISAPNNYVMPNSNEWLNHIVF